MKKKGNVNEPKLRFKGFTEVWGQSKLSDLVERASTLGSDEDLPRIEYEDIISGTGKLNKDIFAKKSSKIGVQFHAGDILYGKLRPYLKNWLLPSFDGLAVGDFWVLRPQNIDGRFLYSLIQSNRFNETANQSTGTKMPRADWRLVSKTEFSIPSTIEEQEYIGRFMLNVDHLINLHQFKFEALKKIKKSFLQKMFPKEGEKFPEVRFPGFTDAWEQRRFSELYEKVSRKNDMRYGKDYIISVANMYYKPDSYITDDSYLLTYNVFELGDIAFEGNKSKNFAHGRFVENTIGNGIVSHVFDVFRPIMQSYDLSFWKYLINNELIMGNILVRCTKASTMMTNLVASDFLSENISVPSYAEQRAIGQFLSRLDHLITLHQRKLEKLKNIKKSCLEKMFV